MAVRLDKLQATYAGNIESVKASVDLKNGEFVALGARVEGERELFQAGAPTDVETQEVLLVASPELTYESGTTILDFVNKAGKPARAYHLYVGDIITVTDDVIDGTSVVGQYLVPQNGKTKLAPAADLSDGTRFAAQVIEKTTIYGQPATAFRVVKN